MAALLEVDGLTKAFGGLVAVNDMSLSVSPGEVLGLIGPNGSGKTTTLNLIAGALRCDDGDIRFKGETINALPIHHIASASTAPFSSCACRPTCRRLSASWRA